MSTEINDPRIDIAIKSYPLAEVPDDFTIRTMALIREKHPQIRFRLQFIDLAVPLFSSLFLLLIFGVGAWGLDQFDSHRLDYLVREITYFSKILPSVTLYGVDIILLASLIFFLITSLLAIWFVSSPRKMPRTKYSA
jgi:hypothetical protein